jgi:pimeloyl-ACP methyl ester carboxylesterase
VPAAGHNLPLEAPDAFVQAVVDVTRLASHRDAVADAS